MERPGTKINLEFFKLLEKNASSIFFRLKKNSGKSYLPFLSYHRTKAASYCFQQLIIKFFSASKITQLLKSNSFNRSPCNFFLPKVVMKDAVVFLLIKLTLDFSIK